MNEKIKKQIETAEREVEEEEASGIVSEEQSKNSELEEIVEEDKKEKEEIMEKVEDIADEANDEEIINISTTPGGFSRYCPRPISG